MPNWCWNEYTVNGPKKSLRNLFKIINNYADDYSWLPPAFFDEKEHVRTDCLDRLAGDYDEEANIRKHFEQILGRKLDECNDNLRCFDISCSDEIDDQGFCFCFNSAWTPSITIAEYITKRWPDLTFTVNYAEEGCEFCGRIGYDPQHKEEGLYYRSYDFPKECIIRCEDMVDNYFNDCFGSACTCDSSFEDVKKDFLQHYAGRGCHDCKEKGSELCELMQPHCNEQCTLEDYLSELEERFLEQKDA